MPFLSELQVEYRETEPKYKWILLAPLVYKSKQVEDVIVVPKDFKTDFASVPRIPFIFSLLGDTAQKAAVVHDYLYSVKSYARSQCDSIFLEAMEDSDVSWWRRKLIYAGVRIGGWTAYDD